jgi:Ribbon-helix-helix protein, copG family
MATTTISLPDDQLARLRLFAAMKGRPPDEIIREAVEAYLAQLPDLPTPRVREPEVTLPDAEWQARWDAALAAIRSKVPPDMTPEEIEREITLASEEVRQERIARRERDRG